jgi:uncharacterized protein (DUF1800 family)
VNDTLEMPSKNASKADWAAYAIAQGMDEADAEDMTRNELAEHFADEDEAAVEAAPATATAIAMKAGGEDLPPELRATAVHRAIK